MNKYSIALIHAVTILVFNSCSPEKPSESLIEKHYSYNIRVETSDQTYLLRSHSMRFWKFRKHTAPDSIRMFAYSIKRPSRSDRIFTSINDEKNDTTEILINRAQADSTFILTKAFFNTISISNYDSTKATQFWTDDTGGKVTLQLKHLEIAATIPAFHVSRIGLQSVAFFRLQNYFRKAFTTSKR